MLSYHSNSQETVSKIYHRLQLEHIPLWFNEQKETMNNLKERYEFLHYCPFSKRCNYCSFS
jgi:hypothetical protein